MLLDLSKYLTTMSRTTNASRLWERFELSDINARLSNLYEHLRDVVNEVGPPPPDYSETVDEIQSLFTNHQAKVSAVANDWHKQLAVTSAENNKLKDEIKTLRAKLSHAKRDGVLIHGVEQYIAMKTNEMKEALQSMTQQKDKALQQLKQEKKRQIETAKKMNEYRQKYVELQKTVAEMRKHDTYDVNEGIAEERNEYRRKYEELRVQHERRKFELDGKFSAELVAICKKMKTPTFFDKETTRKLWQHDLDKLRKIYDDTLKKKELDWQKAKRESLQTLDREYQHLHNQNKDRLKDALQENKDLKAESKQMEQSYKRRMADYDSKMSKLREEMKQVEADNDRLQATATQNEQLKRELKQKEESYKRKVVEYDVQISNLRESMKQMQADRDRFRKQREQKAKQLTSKTRELADLQTELSNVRESLQQAEASKQRQHEADLREVKAKRRDLTESQTELSKYKVLWQHFFGLDADLKTEINEAQKQLSKLEQKHNIRSPIPKKQQRKEVESIKEWMATHSFPPLVVDDIPSPNDEHQRFQLFNRSNVTIRLKNFRLVTDQKHSFPIDPNIQIRGRGYITVALKKQREKTDILVPSDFRFTFQENKALYLDDGKQKVQIFPIAKTETVHTRLDLYLDQHHQPPLRAIPLEEANDKVRGLEIQNAANCAITLDGHYFRNERKTFQVDIPCRLIDVGESFRLIAVKDDDKDSIGRKVNDILVPFDKVQTDVDDILYLCDNMENKVKIYEWTQPDSNHNSRAIDNHHSCYVM